MNLSSLQNSSDLCHVGYVVRNMEEALERWRCEGAVVVIEPTIDPIQNVSCAFLVAQGFLPVELVAPTGEGKSPLSARLKKGGGLDHVCRFVDDIEGSFNLLVAEGAVPLVSPVFGCVWNRMIAFVFLKSGLVLELMSRSIADTKREDPLALWLDASKT